MSTVEQLPTVAPFAAPPQDVLAALGTDEHGLSSQAAARRLAEVGPNRLPEPPRRPALLRFLAHFDDVLIYILLAAAVLKALLGEWVDFAVILVVAVVNALVGYVQEGRAASALAGIATMLSLDAQALRDGAWRHVDAEGLVPGDWLRLRAVLLPPPPPAMPGAYDFERRAWFDRIGAVGFAVGAPQRVPSAPDVPTTAEAGMPELLTENWYGMVAPAHTPPRIVAALNKAAVEAMKDQQVLSKLSSQGAILIGDSPEHFHDFIASETAKWAKVIKDAGVQTTK